MTTQPAAASKRPQDTPFKQQKLKSWQPILTPPCVISTFLVIAAIFIAIGAGILASSAKVIDVGPIRYDDDNDQSTFVSFEWPEDTSDKVFFYYQLSNFYQNHRRYVKSRSDVQLAGKTLKDKKVLGDCTPWEYWEDHMPDNYDDIDKTGKTPDQIKKLKLNPCGLIANSQFNDTFRIFDGVCKSASECDAATEKTGDWTKEGIAWSSDKEKKFHNLEGFDGTPTVEQQKDIEDEEFIVWMRTAGLPTFKKLHRIFKNGLKKGKYTIRIEQNFPVHSFDGKKAFYLTTTTWIGGRNDFLGWAYVVVGLFSFVTAVLFFLKHKLDPRALGDPRSMKEWKN